MVAVGYVDPGSYIQQVNEPGSVSVTSERTPAIVAIAPRTRRVTSEAVIRGKVYDETLTVAAVSPHTATLTNTCDRSRNNSVLYANANAMGLGDWSFVAATITGNAVAGATANTTTNTKFTISLDGKKVLTITLTSGAATPITTIATDINTALAADPAYGTAYNAVATTITGAVANDTLVITSPITTSASDVKVFLSYQDLAATYADAASTISNAAWVPTAAIGYQAPTVVRVTDAVYNSSTTYTIDYVTVDTVVDPLTSATATTPLSSITYVGAYPGAVSYTKNSDYEKTGNTVDWVTTSSAEANLTGIAGPYAIVLATNDALLMSINDGAQLTVTLTAGGAQTAAQVAEDINLALNASTNYGPQFSHCAYVVGGTTLAVTTPDPFENYPTAKGNSSSVQFFTVANNAFTTLFGIPASSLPYETLGTGSRPAFATTYYVTYDHTRASTDYTEPHRVYNPTQLYEYTSPLTIDNYTRNKLCIAGEIAFENDASSIYLIQIDDTTVPGTPSTAQIRAAIDVCEQSSSITEVIVIDTSLDSAVYLQEHVSDMSSLYEKKPRRGWYGMARGSDIGDPDTPDTLVYRSTVTLQPGNTSPGRGRQILQAPTEADRILTLEDDREVTIEVDGSYLSVAVAAHFASLDNPSDAMVGDTIVGFEIENFETYLDAERHTLADSGVNVITMTGGRAVMLDPLTTEAGGAGVVSFEEPQSSAANDVLTSTINNLLDNNVRGVVPDDLADFVSDIKSWIKNGIEANIESGVIGPYRNADGTSRRLNPQTDIRVAQSTDPRTFTFKYWYYLKYPAKRFFGEYSVDNPFFSSSE